MQHVTGFGYPTPPASPVYGARCLYQQPITTVPHCQARYIPLTPEARLGQYLEGKLQLTSILGTGAYGVVYGAIDIKTGIRYAVKCLSKFNPDGTPLDRRQLAFQNREIRLHYSASAHQNVVSMLKIVDEPDCIYVILEYCPEGDLFLNITERGQYVGKDALAKRVFLQILDAVEHCHSLGIYHRDLKPENILVTDHGDTVKLADFGLAIAADRSEDYGCGSTFYMSPECLDHDARKPYYYCAPNDVWSLGVVLVNLTCGRNPWKQASCEDSTYRAYLRSKDFLKTILPVSDDLNDILGRIFTRDPTERISIRELRARIMECPGFTLQAQVSPAAAPVPVVFPTPPASPQPTHPVYVTNPAPLDQDATAALSPTSSASDDDSDCSDDDVSLISSDSTIDDMDDDFFREQQQETSRDVPLFAIVSEESSQQPQALASHHEYVAEQYTGPVPPPRSFHEQVPYQLPHIQAIVPAPPIPHHPQPQPQHLMSTFMPEKPYMPSFWDHMVKYVQQVPPSSYQPHHHQPLHHQVPLFVAPQGCY